MSTATLQPPVLPLNGETLLGLSTAASRNPAGRGSGRLHPATLTRWILVGSKSLSGSIVKLEALRCGQRWCTSEAALARFFEALARTDEVKPIERTSEKKQKRAAEAADKELVQSGW